MSLTRHPRQHLQAAKLRIMHRHGSMAIHLPLALTLLAMVHLLAGPKAATLQQGVDSILQCTPSSLTPQIARQGWCQPAQLLQRFAGCAGGEPSLAGGTRGRQSPAVGAAPRPPAEAPFTSTDPSCAPSHVSGSHLLFPTPTGAPMRGQIGSSLLEGLSPAQEG